MDLRSPFVVSILDLPRQEGSIRHYDYVFETPQDFGIELMEVIPGSELRADLSFQSVQEGVLVQGSVDAQLQGRCSRCLIDLHDNVHESVAELVFYPESAKALEEEGDEEANDLPLIEDDHIDLEPILRDALVLSMPFTPLCEPDCDGLCQECGERWSDLPDDHAHEFLDPRFDGLAALAAELEVKENNA
ncbi:uncharacterized protein JOD55_001047 [Arcanobacterium pluranimalium]|uniref:YceD family protein n=1 Tax=Arcanobacterium pluranimalium TaxID=108028 RepID=UPI00195E1846|nr:uncharacterized protein [Arcanobacterium pluranimalium]